MKRQRTAQQKDDKGTLGIENFGAAMNWNRLQFMNYGPLDYWPREYQVYWLREAALRLRSNGPLDDSMRWYLGQCLIDLADNEAAMGALNSNKGRSAELRALNIAVHYAAESERLGKAEAARKQVANVWSAKEASVKDAYRRHGPKARALLSSIVQRHGDRGRALGQLCEDMADRATISWLQKGRQS